MSDTSNPEQISSVLSYTEWLKSKWRGIPIWVLFALAMGYNLLTEISLFSLTWPLIVSLIWYQHYNYYAKNPHKKSETSNLTKVVAFLIIAVILFAILISILSG